MRELIYRSMVLIGSGIAFCLAWNISHTAAEWTISGVYISLGILGMLSGHGNKDKDMG